MRVPRHSGEELQERGVLEGAVKVALEELELVLGCEKPVWALLQELVSMQHSLHSEGELVAEAWNRSGAHIGESVETVVVAIVVVVEVAASDL